MTARRLGWLFVALLATSSVAGLAWVAFHRAARAHQVVDSNAPGKRKAVSYEVAETVFDGRLADGWKDWGWGPHELRDAGPARIRFSDFGGIILQHESMQATYGALAFRFQAPPACGNFLQVSI